MNRISIRTSRRRTLTNAQKRSNRMRAAQARNIKRKEILRQWEEQKKKEAKEAKAAAKRAKKNAEKTPVTERVSKEKS